MYGYSSGYNSYPSSSTNVYTHGGGGYDQNRDAWTTTERSPSNYSPAYSIHEFDRPHTITYGSSPGPASCTASCCCPRTSSHHQPLRHHPASWAEYYPPNTYSCAGMTMERPITHEFSRDARENVIPHGFVTWNVALIQLFTFVTGVMHEADNASSGAPGCVIGGSGFLTVAFNDPREWSPLDVVRWLHWAARTFRIPNPYPERFQMNGKALCLMDLNMFLYRVPEGGDMLYQDFQCRLQKALHDERAMASR